MAVAELQNASHFKQCSERRALTDLSRRVPRSFWNKVPESSSLNSARGRFRSSWKKNCASWNLALSTASLPVCTTHAHAHSHLSWNLSVGRKNGFLSHVRSDMQSTGFWQCVLWHQTRQVKWFGHVLNYADAKYHMPRGDLFAWPCIWRQLCSIYNRLVVIWLLGCLLAETCGC